MDNVVLKDLLAYRSRSRTFNKQKTIFGLTQVDGLESSDLNEYLRSYTHRLPRKIMPSVLVTVEERIRHNKILPPVSHTNIKPMSSSKSFKNSAYRSFGRASLGFTESMSMMNNNNTMATPEPKQERYTRLWRTSPLIIKKKKLPKLRPIVLPTFDEVKPKVDHTNQRLPILDFSFKFLTSLPQLLDLTPVSLDPTFILPKKSKPIHIVHDELDINQESHNEIIADPKYCARGLKLGNNSLTNLQEWATVLPMLIKDFTTNLVWIDLSLNKFTNIPKEIMQLSQLSILFMHSNHISQVDDLDLLRNVSKTLITLTLIGNSVSEHPQYRMKLITYLPHLKNLDFGSITPTDRETITTKTIKKSIKNQ